MDITKFGICEQDQTPNHHFSHFSGSQSIAERVNQFLGQSSTKHYNKHSDKSSKKCIPLNAVVSTSVASIVSNDKIFQRVIDVALLNHHS
jgi:hypothetical protein